MLSLPVLVVVSLSFVPSLVILTLFFASILAGGSTKNTYYRRAFVVSFLGLAVGAACGLAAPFLPNSVPVMDAGVVLAVISWVFLLRRYHGTSWLESLPPAFLAALIYIVITAVASGFSILLLQG